MHKAESREGTKRNKQKTNNKMVELNLTMSRVTLNMNDLNPN